jgi:hypothetical protein
MNTPTTPPAHSPAPYSLSYSPRGTGEPWILDTNGICFAIVCPTGNGDAASDYVQMGADAQRILAIPDLLNACIKAAESYECRCGEDAPGGCAHCLLQAAIGKATSSDA